MAAGDSARIVTTGSDPGKGRGGRAWYGYSGVSWYDTAASKGYIWVEFFFALSGFILFHAYGARFGAGRRAEAIGPFSGRAPGASSSGLWATPCGDGF